MMAETSGNGGMANRIEIDVPDEPLGQTREIRETEGEEENRNQETWKCLSRVPEVLLRFSPYAFKPLLISIGPYHRGLGERVKQRFQIDFFRSRDGLAELSRMKLMDLKDLARSWYPDDVERMIDDPDFVEMLLLDGCFILEFFYKLNDGNIQDTHQIIRNNDRRVTNTLIDLLLFENQFPFFVLYELYKLNPHQTGDSLQKLIQLVKKSFADVVPKLTPHNFFAHEDEPGEIKHLLQLVHSFCIPKNHERYFSSSEIIEHISTATELEKDGVNFKKIGKIYRGLSLTYQGPRTNEDDSTTLFDIDFDNGKMKIPCFKIIVSSERFFRNMIAYEHHYRYATRYFTDFAYFMHNLIGSPEDVTLFRRRGIILKITGTDEDVVDMFNKLPHGTTVSFIFSEVYHKVNQFSEKTSDKLWAKLKRNCFDDPWKAVSIVSLVSLVLTVVIVVKSFIPKK